MTFLLRFLPTSYRLLPTNSIRKSNSRLEVALRHVVGVHPEEIGVMVRVLETDNVHFPA